MKQIKKSDKLKIRKKEYEIKLLSPHAIMPKKAVRGAIGYDLCVPRDFRVPAHSRVAIPLDIAINLPFGVEAKIEPRSGCSLHGIEGYGKRIESKGKFLGMFPRKKIVSGKLRFDADVMVGKVDPNYTDNIHVLLVNRDETFLIRKGSRIAQLTFYHTIAPFFKQVDELTCATRGGGLGHTGVDRLRHTRVVVAPIPEPIEEHDLEEDLLDDDDDLLEGANQEEVVADSDFVDTSDDYLEFPEENAPDPNLDEEDNDHTYGVHV